MRKILHRDVAADRRKQKAHRQAYRRNHPAKRYAAKQRYHERNRLVPGNTRHSGARWRADEVRLITTGKCLSDRRLSRLLGRTILAIQMKRYKVKMHSTAKRQR